MSLYTRKSEKYESSDSVAVPPELNLTFPTRMEIGATRYEWSSHEIQSQLPIDILLITVKDHEFNSCYSYMKLKQIRRCWCDNLGMVDFGEFGERNVSRVALIKCQMGPMSAVIIVKNAAEILNPKVVLFVGFCATVNPVKAKLGDVLISSKLATYASKKITADGTVELRGIKANVSRNMARLILSADHGWVPPLKDASQSLKIKVHSQAVILSGPELVNYHERGAELLRHCPDALGLDMEGEGLYAAAYDLGIEWAVIKGVSNFADGSKKMTENWQPNSSAMAASVVYNMFKHPDVIQNWPNYKKVETVPLAARADVVSTPSRPFREDQPARSRTVVRCSIDEFIQRASFGDSGQCKYRDRMIKFESDRRLPNVLTESWTWKYEATATDKMTGITMKRGNFLEEDKAVKYTIKALLEKLQELNFLD